MAGSMCPVHIKVTAETQADSKLMYIIWLYLVVLCSLNNFSWKVEVNPSWLEKGISPGKKHRRSPGYKLGITRINGLLKNTK